ncbi:hypothetical protein CRE_31322 [Caenorhabditis remanei]|uniref:Uncharacterized protein n=1 Tax=Caenorhabditis remanei TaxID=31234 RepID=E3MLV0_CAERE|nr:hypothetical protein CRE_31322 [Caenorhabditis remanei]
MVRHEKKSETNATVWNGKNAFNSVGQLIISNCRLAQLIMFFFQSKEELSIFMHKICIREQLETGNSRYSSSFLNCTNSSDPMSSIKFSLLFPDCYQVSRISIDLESVFQRVGGMFHRFSKPGIH